MQPQPATDDAPTPDAPITSPDAAQVAVAAGHRLPFQGKTRRGFTTNKGHGTPKAKRKQAAASRHRNRGK